MRLGKKNQLEGTEVRSSNTQQVTHQRFIEEI